DGMAVLVRRRHQRIERWIEEGGDVRIAAWNCALVSVGHHAAVATTGAGRLKPEIAFSAVAGRRGGMAHDQVLAALRRLFGISTGCACGLIDVPGPATNRPVGAQRRTAP